MAFRQVGTLPPQLPLLLLEADVERIEAGPCKYGTAAALGLQIPGKEYLNVYNSDPTGGHLQVKAS